MYDVAVYLSSLPRIADHNRKVQVLRAFAEGAAACGLSVVVPTTKNIEQARLAVILGWVGTKISGPHIELRQAVISMQRATGNHIMPIDSSCFKFVDTESYFLRYSLGGVYYNTDNYANKNSDNTKWEQISRHFTGVTLKPWRTEGNHILLCLQRDGGWSMKGTDLNTWAIAIAKQIRATTNRPIVVRPHPKAPIDLNQFAGIANLTMSPPDKALQHDLINAWAAVFYNSSSAVAAVLAGIPVFTFDSDAVAWNISNHDLFALANPSMPNRQQWLNDLCAAHWTDAESRSGVIYKKFQQYL